ncbi:MAG TPA: PAS domain-containing protein [Candidatus Deferrimicrobiaceae bacterium]
MNPFYDWVGRNPELVYLVYGMAFAIMGIAIWVQPHKGSRHSLAGVLWLYVAYALIHAPADFIDMWTVIHGRNEALFRVAQLLTYVSYAFLFEFGRRLLGLVGRTLPAWLMPLLFAAIAALSVPSAFPWVTSNVLVGYLVRFPGGVLSAAGFYRYYLANRTELQPLGSRRYFLGAAGATLAWAFFCGCIRANAAFFPANLLNVDTFLVQMHVPVHLFRTFFAVVMAWAVVGILRIFDQEIVARLETAREAIARQLTETEHRALADRLRSDEALRESEERYALAVRGSNDGIWDWNVRTGEMHFSERCLEMMGYAEREVEYNVDAWSSRIHPDDFDRVTAALADLTGGRNRHIDTEYRLLHKDGSYRWVQGRGTCLFDEAGQPVRIAGSLTDLTARKRLEDQLLQAQKMEAVGRLAGGVAHDFNNLLTAILGYCELLLGRLDPRNPNRHDIEEINKAGERAASLTGQLLAFSRRQMLQPRVVNLNDVVRDMDKMLQRLIGEDIELETRTQAGIPNILIDPGQLEQVLVNLAVNARDAMPDGGRLIVETSAVGVEDHAGLLESGIGMPLPAVLLSVSDTGIGMDDETREHIFEPFFTTKEKGKGTGLGLSTTYGIVQQSGGHVLVESSPGNGATFRIYLPSVTGDVGVGKIEKPAEAMPVRGELLLVVEDEEAVRRLVRESLEQAGYRVLVAADGVEGVELAKQHLGEIRLVLSDIVMPRLGGCEMADRIEEMCPGVGIVLMSGYTEESVAQQGAMGKGRGYLQKPFRPAALVRKIREAMGIVSP